MKDGQRPEKRRGKSDTHAAVDVVERMNFHDLTDTGKLKKCFPILMGTSPRMSTPSRSHLQK